MKLRIEFISGDSEEEIIIRCRDFNENVKKQCEAIEALINNTPAIVYYKDDSEYYLPSKKILFFETDGEDVAAHTANDAFKVTLRLYQLEEILPHEFIRISKSAVVNTAQILSLSRNLPSSAQITFVNTHKKVYVSKFYFKALKEKLSQRR